MTIDFSDKQLTLLKEVLQEYRDECYDGMFEFRDTAAATDDETIRSEYTKLALGEEVRFNETKELLEFVEKYEELMKGR